VLHLLVANAGHLVQKEELIGAVWPNVTVSEESITQCVSEVRQALKDRDHTIIKTIARRGYLFAAPVEKITCQDEADVWQSAVPPELSARPVSIAQQESGRPPVRCAKCGAANTPAARSCCDCGALLMAPNSMVATSGPERRQVTILSCNVLGSAPAHLDPEDLREVMSICDGCVRGVVERHGGTVAQTTANGFLVYFGYPQAHEDDAERAVRAGLEVISATAALRIGCLAMSLRPRVGIATGSAVLGDLVGNGANQRELVGDAIQVAGHLESLAEPDTVAIEATTRRLIG